MTQSLIPIGWLLYHMFWYLAFIGGKLLNLQTLSLFPCVKIASTASKSLATQGRRASNGSLA